MRRTFAFSAIAAAALAILPAAAQAQSILAGPFLQQASPTAIWIVWETTSGEESRVDFGMTPALGETAFGETIVSEGTARIHQTELASLAADTRYYYQVTTGAASSAVQSFRTPEEASAEGPLRIVAFSDTQFDFLNLSQFGETVNAGVIDFVQSEFGPEVADELDFVLIPGDLVDDGSVHADWQQQFFGEAQSLFQTVPVYPVLGNHEGDDPLYFKYFRLPDNGTPGFEEHWYSIDQGNVRIVGLDSNSGYRIQAQLDWLDDVLADAAANPAIDFVLAQLHHPYKSELWTPGELAYTGEVIERLELFTATTGKPSMNLFGHTHAYSRGQSRDDAHLWINVASGEGNIDYWGESGNADYPEFQRSFPEWGFVLLEVEAGPNPSVRVRRVSRGNDIQARDNEVRDDFTLRTLNTPPATPAALAPASGGVAPDSVVLEGSPFSDADGDGHLESQFQVTTVSGDYSAPVRDAWIRFENWYSPPGATGLLDGYYSIDTVLGLDVTAADAGELAPNTTYFWRVRYRDTGFRWSAWSAETSFSTGASTLSANLLANPGAESGVASWTVLDPPLDSLAQGDCGETTPPVAGARFFNVGGVCGDQGPYGEAFQSVDVSADAAAIDAGDMNALYGGYLRNAGDSDIPEIWLVFRSGGGAVLLTAPKLTHRTSAWTQVARWISVPVGTRAIEFHMSGARLSGTDNDAYFDELSLRTGSAALPCLDMDGDGYGNPALPGCANEGLDCDDGAASVHPGAAEVPGNGRDDDCDGTVDEGGGGGCAALPAGASAPGAAPLLAYGLALVAIGRAARRRGR